MFTPKTKIAAGGPSKPLLAAMLLSAVTLFATMPAFADHDHDWHHDHGWHRGWHRGPPRGYVEPGYVYAPPPPPVAYAPPPEPVYSEPAGINLILPLHFH